MEVLHRPGEDRSKRAASTAAGSTALAAPALEENIIADDELEIRASHITAAAVAAASVTAAVVTEAAAAAATDASGIAAVTVAALPPSPSPKIQPQPAVVELELPPGAPNAAASARAAWPVSLLTLVVIGLALWWSAQWPWPQRALKPIVSELPSLRKTIIAPVVPAAPAPLATAPAAEAPPVLDQIAVLQEEAEEKARQLAQKRAAADARHRREDAVLAQRELRRREAEAQLADARAKAERAQAAALTQPEIIEVAPAPSLADQVKQCSALSLFARESCLWKLCNGQWGKNGCPSYERNSDGA
ncbi:phage tail protein [Herbaspirillum sp. LeCh32-8]|uniref:phage tail protein n=1 Tax=Herbaspirillum sp. LeCh32-8 TaxID=2821356 RepID=UPI001AE54F67|nr:phage tail protein [Herbaspirillum sp. LeCh32-8]MBP0598594.1 phage tail protein [Herbaspirillum sp. LeCh32-8]